MHDNTTGADAKKTTVFVHYAATKAEDEHYAHYLGQKGLPMFASLYNFDYEKFNIPDWMHNVSRYNPNPNLTPNRIVSSSLNHRLFIWLVRLIVGRNGTGAWSNMWTMDDRHRDQAQKNGVFPSIWPDAPQHLEQGLETELRDTSEEDIRKGSRTWCLRWWRVCKKKVPTGTRIAELRSQIMEWRTHLQTPDSRLIISRGN